MSNRKDYITPGFRIVEARYEYSLLQSTGTDRADEGYNPGIDLEDLD